MTLFLVSSLVASCGSEIEPMTSWLLIHELKDELEKVENRVHESELVESI